MTKIYFANSILDYRQDMAEAVRQLIRENYIGGVKPFIGDDPRLSQPDLLPPPRIEAIELHFYQGRVDDQVMLCVTSDFGLASVSVVIMDGQGNLIERGEADPISASAECWSYVARVDVPAGTSVTVQAAAVDRLGGAGTLRTQTIM
jgi:hypothetical protein